MLVSPSLLNPFASHIPHTDADFVLIWAAPIFLKKKNFREESRYVDLYVAGVRTCVNYHWQHSLYMQPIAS